MCWIPVGSLSSLRKAPHLAQAVPFAALRPPPSSALWVPMPAAAGTQAAPPLQQQRALWRQRTTPVCTCVQTGLHREGEGGDPAQPRAPPSPAVLGALQVSLRVSTSTPTQPPARCTPVGSTSRSRGEETEARKRSAQVRELRWKPQAGHSSAGCLGAAPPTLTAAQAQSGADPRPGPLSSQMSDSWGSGC